MPPTCWRQDLVHWKGHGSKRKPKTWTTVLGNVSPFFPILGTFGPATRFWPKSWHQVTPKMTCFCGSSWPWALCFWFDLAADPLPRLVLQVAQQSPTKTPRSVLSGQLLVNARKTLLSCWRSSHYIYIYSMGDSYDFRLQTSELDFAPAREIPFSTSLNRFCWAPAGVCKLLSSTERGNGGVPTMGATRGMWPKPRVHVAEVCLYLWLFEAGEMRAFHSFSFVLVVFKDYERETWQSWTKHVHRVLAGSKLKIVY